MPLLHPSSRLSAFFSPFHGTDPFTGTGLSLLQTHLDLFTYNKQLLDIETQGDLDPMAKCGYGCVDWTFPFSLFWVPLAKLSAYFVR